MLLLVFAVIACDGERRDTPAAPRARATKVVQVLCSTPYGNETLFGPGHCHEAVAKFLKDTPTATISMMVPIQGKADSTSKGGTEAILITYAD